MIRVSPWELAHSSILWLKRPGTICLLEALILWRRSVLSIFSSRKLLFHFLAKRRPIQLFLRAQTHIAQH